VSSTSSALFCMFVLVSFCYPFFSNSDGGCIVVDWDSGCLVGLVGVELF
jgi:hypothetical protein